MHFNLLQETEMGSATADHTSIISIITQGLPTEPTSNIRSLRQMLSSKLCGTPLVFVSCDAVHVSIRNSEHDNTVITLPIMQVNAVAFRNNHELILVYMTMPNYVIEVYNIRLSRTVYRITCYLGSSSRALISLIVSQDYAIVNRRSSTHSAICVWDLKTQEHRVCDMGRVLEQKFFDETRVVLLTQKSLLLWNFRTEETGTEILLQCRIFDVVDRNTLMVIKNIQLAYVKIKTEEVTEIMPITGFDDIIHLKFIDSTKVAIVHEDNDNWSWSICDLEKKEIFRKIGRIDTIMQRPITVRGLEVFWHYKNKIHVYDVATMRLINTIGTSCNTSQLSCDLAVL